MTAKEIWCVDVRTPLPGMETSWSPVYTWPDADEMTEEDADEVIALYKRAMPEKEYRKRSWLYDPDVDGATGGIDDDIPF
jgi:hypothetical protein